MSLHELELVLLAALVVVVAGGVGLALHLRYWDRRLGVALPYEVEERLATADGTAIELRRLPSPDAPSALPPVILVHGLGANHRNNDCLPDYSLARHLRSLGRDVWLVTLRSGLGATSRLARRLVRFEAMVQHDLPLAVDTVLAKTGSPRLDFVGFSMGGMLLYAALERSVPQSKLRRVAIVGSPAVVSIPFPVPRFLLARAALAPTLPLRLMGRASAFAAEWVTTPFHRVVFNPDNVAKGVASAALVNLLSDVPFGLHADFAGWALAGGKLTLAGEGVLERLAQVAVPAVFLAGGADRLAPPEAVRVAFEAWGAALPDVDKRFVLLSRAAGAKHDYGHGDLVIGRNVRDEVFTPIADFLGLA